RVHGGAHLHPLTVDPELAETGESGVRRIGRYAGVVDLDLEEPEALVQDVVTDGNLLQREALVTGVRGLPGRQQGPGRAVVGPVHVRALRTVREVVPRLQPERLGLDAETAAIVKDRRRRQITREGVEVTVEHVAHG